MAISGRLDAYTSIQLQEELLPVFDETNAELDFAELVYVSSAGLRVLLLGEKTAKAKGYSMNLINVSKDIKEIFEMTGFSDILKIA